MLLDIIIGLFMLFVVLEAIDLLEANYHEYKEEKEKYPVECAAQKEILKNLRKKYHKINRKIISIALFILAILYFIFSL